MKDYAYINWKCQIKRLSFGLGIVFFGLLLISCQNMNKGSHSIKPVTNSEDKFAVWASSLDGKNMRMLVSDPYRQMTHIRVSPDKKWFTFTRYNNRGKNNCAEETPENYPKDQNYLETEIMIGNLETLEIKSLIPPKKNQMAVNSYWNSQGDKMLFVYVPQGAKKPQIEILSFDENKNIIRSDTLKLPDYLLPVDPQQVNDLIVFPAVNLNDSTRGVWTINSDGSSLRQIAFPKDLKTGHLIKLDRGGDNDPKISPDLKTVVFMRLVNGRHNWHVYTVDIESGKEIDLSEGNIDNIFEADAVPEWSSDGKLLAIWHIKVGLFKRDISIVTMNPDGSGRKKFEYPEGYHVQSVAFFPNQISISNPHIVFSTTKTSHNCE